MPSCPSCGAARTADAVATPCPKCGAKSASNGGGRAAPELELNVPKRPALRQAPKVEEAEVKLELAIDPRSLIEGPPPAQPPSTALAKVEPRAVVVAGRPGGAPLANVGEVGFDASLLAEYGDPPGHWILAPLYAWRVLRRQRELKKALAGRREEAKRAAHEVEDALVAFAERIRPAAEKRAELTRAFEELRGAEDVLRSRDRVLASEQDAQTARLASVDARLAKLEAELAQAQSHERLIAAELASTQAGLARGESKLKRAESELRAAQQRETDGSHV